MINKKSIIITSEPELKVQFLPKIYIINMIPVYYLRNWSRRRSMSLA